MKKLLLFFFFISPVLADQTVGKNVTNTVTTANTTIGTAVAIFSTDVACFSILVEALGANTDDIHIVVDANKDVGSETTDAVTFTKAAREPFLVTNMDSGHLFLFVDSGTMGVSAICETGQ